MKLYKYIILTLSILIAGHAMAQSDAKMADKYFTGFDYELAIPYLKRIAEKNPSAEVYEKLAESYRLTGDVKNAEINYSKAVAYPNSKPIDRYYYAEILRGNAKYKEAKKQYLEYSQLRTIDSAKAVMFARSCDSSLKWIENPVDVRINNELKLNTENADWGTTFYKNGLVLTSDRNATVLDKGKRTKSILYGWTGKPYLKLFYSVQNADSVWAEPMPFEKTINDDYHNGPAVFTDGDRKIYFTKTELSKNPEKLTNNKAIAANFIHRKELYYSENTNGVWGKVKTFQYNNLVDYSIQHPAISPDGNTLYFSSDMPGSIGKFDLYYCSKLSEDNWSTPVNCGNTINTEGNEGFPSIGKDGTLYFASDGLLGMGGLDIFSAKGAEGTWKNVTNLKYPFNSPKDDFSPLFMDNLEEGYFSSNRDGGVGSDDIYHFKIKKPLLCNASGLVVSKNTQQPIPGAKVVLEEANGNRQNAIADEKGEFSFAMSKCDNAKLYASKEGYEPADGNIYYQNKEISPAILKLEMVEKAPEPIIVPGVISFALEGYVKDKTGNPVDSALVRLTNVKTTESQLAETKANGYYKFKLEPSSTYSVKGQKTGYISDKKDDITTEGLTESKLLTADLILDKIELNKAIKVENIYYDVNKWFIRPDAAKELDKLVILLQENPEIEIELGSHTDCRASDLYNNTLSQKRATSAVEYIVTKGKIDRSRITAKGYGETQLINRCKDGVQCSDEEHQQNRRTEIKITKIRAGVKVN